MNSPLRRSNAYKRRSLRIRMDNQVRMDSAHVLWDARLVERSHDLANELHREEIVKGPEGPFFSYLKSTYSIGILISKYCLPSWPLDVPIAERYPIRLPLKYTRSGMPFSRSTL